MYSKIKKSNLFKHPSFSTIKELIESPLFLIGLIFKIVLSFFFASDVFKNFFIPFVNFFTIKNQNPYLFFSSQGVFDIFPYPSLMLYILAVPVKLLNSVINLQDYPSLEIFIYRIPIFFADLVILFVLASFLKKYKQKILCFYWLSPVLIYINYIHGQLDVIPMALFFTSLYFLFKDKGFLAYFFLGCSLATKTHVLLVLPFILMYSLGQKKTIKEITLYFLVTIATFLLLNINYIGDLSFLNMVFNNAQQSKILNFYFSFSEQHRYFLIPAAYIFLVIKGFSLVKKINKPVLIMFIGFTFGIVTFFMPPSQGWYYWIIPVFIYFYIRSKTRYTYAFWILQIFYFLYFLTIPNSNFLNIVLNDFTQIQLTNLYHFISRLSIDGAIILDVIFTFLQTAILINCLYVYQAGVTIFSNQKITSLPFFVGIGGDSGAGKTTLSNSIQKLFPVNKTTLIRGDDMHKWERGDDNWKTFTHLNPKANELHNEFSLLSKLKNGQQILRRHYDHSTGKFTSSEKIRPNNVMIFEGLHPFYIKKMRSLYDLKIYMAPDQDLHLYWKITRDMRDRGYSKEKILQQIENRAMDSNKYIKTQNKHADIEIGILPSCKITNYEKEQDFNLQLRLKISNDINIEPLLEKIQFYGGGEIEHTYDDNDTQVIYLKHELDSLKIEAIAEEVMPNLEDIGIQNPEWENGFHGYLQLFISYFISQQITMRTHEY